MDESKRKVVVLLCMHRSGSSLTANLLQRLGMSLGPFDLIGAEVSNPYGHFEAIPFHIINRKIQDWAFGFADDVPSDPEVLARFVETQGAWPSKPVPEEWFQEARDYVGHLAASGQVSGFKDPRTVLTWPFWKRVFDSIDQIEVAPVALLRSPHEIAMSLCTRSRGNMPYWHAMDVVGVHLARMKEVVAEAGDAARIVRFGTSHFMSDARRLVESCGLNWDDAIVDQVYDRTCVHHQPAIVPHAAQESLNDISAGDWADLDAATNAARLARDARKYEAAMHKQLVEAKQQLGGLHVSARLNESRITEAAEAIRVLEARVAKAEAGRSEAEKAFQLADHCLQQAEKDLERTLGSLVATQERLASAERTLTHTQTHAIQLQQVNEQASARLDALQKRNLELERAEATADQLRESLELAQEAWKADRVRLAETQDRIARLQELAIERDDQFRTALESEHALRLEADELRIRVESRQGLGAAARGRRQIKQIWLKFRHPAPSGSQRTTRIDRPI